MNELKELIKALRPVQTKFRLIRVGGANDGGYLIPDDLDGIAACFSPGVADTASFEVGLCCRGIGSHLADGSVDGAPKGITPLSFTKKYLDGYNDENNITLFSWVLGTDAYQFGEDLILQMDIEGAEYFVLNEDDVIFNTIPLLIIELHPIIIENKLISVEDLKARIEFLGYQILEQYGSNIVAKRK